MELSVSAKILLIKHGYFKCVALYCNEQSTMMCGKSFIHLCTYATYALLRLLSWQLLFKTFCDFTAYFGLKTIIVENA